MSVVSLLLVSLLVSSCLSEDAPTVTTKSGKIVGHYLTSSKGNKYEAYQGIPYAKPAIGERRFEPPVEIEPWTDDLRAVKLKKSCAQGFSAVTSSEDCLYLNVYVPARNTSLPVIFYIHGGSYQIGGPKDSQEHYIIDHDVIFVSIQYRLGVFGFLSTEDEVVPGNMGLKDQSLALKWISNNIEHFGGDSKRITLLGVSSGAASVHLHYLSPWSAGLFHAGMSFSGTALAPWTLAEQSREKAIQVGQLVNCTNSDIRKMIDCMKEKSTDDLLFAKSWIPDLQYQPAVPYAPVIEKSSAANPFLNDFPSRIISKGKAYDVPWITGVVSEEGLLPLASFSTNESLKNLDINWDQIAPILLDYYYTIPMPQLLNTSRTIRNHYFGDKPIDKEQFRTLTNLESDRLFKVSAANAAMRQAAANKSPVFYYQYAHRANDSFSNYIFDTTEDLGVAHGDDVSLVLKNLIVVPTKSPNDMAMQERLIQLWTSVARDGIPKVGVEWPKVNPNSTTLDYLQLNGPNSLEAKSSDDYGQIKFWNSIAFEEDKV